MRRAGKLGLTVRTHWAADRRRSLCHAVGRVSRPDYYGNPAGLTGEADVVRAIYDAFARRDVEGAISYVSPDCELDLAGTARLAGRTGPYRGHDGFRQYFADVERVWEDLVLHADDYRIIPGSVIVIGHVTGRRDGVDVRRSSVWTWRVKDGQATSVKVADLGDIS
jgi:ketosteroid isomerase-like protein